MTFQFPHFSQLKNARVFSSLEMFFLWALLIGLVTVNLISIQKGRPAHWTKLMMLFESPSSLPHRIDLASFLWQQGHKEEARDVLGATTDSLQTLTQWEGEAASLEKKYAFWQSVAASHPDYRDAYVMLASLAYQLGNRDEARSWFTRAQTLDPNSPIIQALTPSFHP